MTEQEKREKAIEEMAQIWCESDISCRDCVKCTIYEGKHCCVHLRNASDMYYYILRREEEVRKETAKEFYDKLTLKNVQNIEDLSDAMVETLKDFGVEVEE